MFKNEDAQPADLESLKKLDTITGPEKKVDFSIKKTKQINTVLIIIQSSYVVYIIYVGEVKKSEEKIVCIHFMCDCRTRFY